MPFNYTWSDFDIELTTQTDGDIKKDIDINAIKNSLLNIVSTITGQRVMLPTFAENGFDLLFEPMDEMTARELGERVLAGILEWEDRIEIEEINVVANYNRNRYDFTLRFKVIGLNQEDDVRFSLNNLRS